MAQTIDGGFALLRSNLEITGLQEETVSTRQKNVRAAVEQGLEVLDSFLTGSYRRSTMIAPLKEADVDVFVVVNAKYYSESGQRWLLEQTKAAVKKTYSRTPDISPNGQAVTIRFDDFKVDVVPGFYRTGGGYLIPDASRGRWISTDPKRHVEIWTAANKKHKGNLVPLLKILKSWNKSRDVLRSFHLETMALSVFDGVTISDFPSGARFFFDKARDKIRVKLADPAGFNDDVGAHVNTVEAMDKIVNGLAYAYEKARQAEHLAAGGHIRDAFAYWGDLFGAYFPAYG
jgi:Second Messenger Oligonucleotide or Dinucleotide Synthetase domain